MDTRRVNRGCLTIGQRGEVEGPFWNSTAPIQTRVVNDTLLEEMIAWSYRGLVWLTIDGRLLICRSRPCHTEVWREWGFYDNGEVDETAGPLLSDHHSLECTRSLRNYGVKRGRLFLNG